MRARFRVSGSDHRSVNLMDIATDWMNGLHGGLLIGMAAAALLLVNGRIAGVSGLLGRLVPPTVWATPASSRAASAAFIAGLIAVPAVMAAAGSAPEIAITGSVPLLIAGGALVGFGTVLGNGCTSGHGVCGLSRGSVRSFVAVCVFMATAAATVWVVRHGPGAGL
jgi:uncharacterized membrane protein YedE/YeeE